MGAKNSIKTDITRHDRGKKINMRAKNQKEKKDKQGLSSIKFAVIMFVIYLVLMPWLKEVYFMPDFQVRFFIKTLFIWVLIFVTSALADVINQKFVSHITWWKREICLLGLSLLCMWIFRLLQIETGEVTPWYVLANTLPLYIFVRVVYLLCHSILLTTMICGYISMGLAATNYYIMLLRDRPFMPWDIYSMETAGNVMGQYHISPTKALVGVYLLVIFVRQFLSAFVRGKEKRSKDSFGIQICCLILCFVVYGSFVYPRIIVNFWDLSEIYCTEGTVNAFLGYTKALNNTAPEGYEEKEAQRYLEQVELETQDKKKTSAQNIIMIMNESMADYTVFGNENFSNNYMPYYNSLQENTIKGNLYVGCYGGNTCDTEYETLSGNNTIWCPTVPYLTKIHKPSETIVSTLEQQEFQTFGFHPLFPNGWNREKVYDLFGFDKKMFLYDIPGSIEDNDSIHGFVSDLKDYKVLIEEFEKKTSKNYYAFNVTIQNHGAYIVPDETIPAVDLSQYGEYSQAEIYLSLLQESDKALQYLIEYFEQVEEPTLICIYGDHQPDLGEEFLELVQGKPMDQLTPQEVQRAYITPVMIWANYDIEEQYIERISANYLSSLVLKTANRDMNAYESYLWQLYEKYPVLTTKGCFDSQGNYYRTLEELPTDEWKQYEKLQYYQINKEKGE